MTNEEAKEYFNNHYEVNSKEQNDAVYLAVMALEKQIPIDSINYKCANCSYLVGEWNYCPICGQRLRSNK